MVFIKIKHTINFKKFLLFLIGFIIIISLFIFGGQIIAQVIDSPPDFILKWGSYCKISDGTGCVDPDGAGPLELGDGQFFQPQGTAVDSSNNVYVADSQNHRIQKFDSNGNYLMQFGTQGYSDGQFNNPYGVTVDSLDNVYVVERYGLNRIQKFDSNGNFLIKWGSSGSGDGQFTGPKDIIVDSSGNVYVADSENNRIQKFDSNGNFITKWGSLGSGDGQFGHPTGVAVDSSGNVYVSDYSNHRIQKFDSDGIYLRQWGGQGSGDGEIYGPRDVAVDSSGNVYVSEYSNKRVQVFDSNGNFITKWGSIGSGDGEFNDPIGVSIDFFGNVYVVDAINKVVQKFGPSSGPVCGNGVLEYPEQCDDGNTNNGDGCSDVCEFEDADVTIICTNGICDYIIDTGNGTIEIEGTSETIDFTDVEISSFSDEASGKTGISIGGLTLPAGVTKSITIPEKQKICSVDDAVFIAGNAIGGWYNDCTEHPDAIIWDNSAPSSNECTGTGVQGWQYGAYSSKYTCDNLGDGNVRINGFNHSTVAGYTSTTQDITTCGTLDIPNRIYTLQNDVYAANCFTIAADGITLDLNGYTISGNNRGRGITISGNNNIKIKNGNFNNFAFGIYLYQSSSNTFTDIVTSNNDYHGIILEQSSDNLFMRTTSKLNQQHGMYISSSSNNEFRNSIIEDSSLGGYYSGIYIKGTSNIFEGGYINRSNNFGIHLYGVSADVSNNFFKDMQISNTQYEDIYIRTDNAGSIALNNVLLNVLFDINDVVLNQANDGGDIELIIKKHFNMHIGDINGDVEGARVIGYDKEYTQLFDELTSSDGTISQQELIESIIYPWIGRVFSTPHIVEVSKEGYETSIVDYNLTEIEDIYHEIELQRPCTDNDEDGYAVEGGECGDIDCDDNNINVYPGASETCNGLDNNCNGLIDDADVDNDGYDDCNGEDMCVNLDMPEPPVPEGDIDPSVYDLTIGGYGCTGEEILYCKPGKNKGEYQQGLSPGTINIWLNQIGWSTDCQSGGVVAIEGVSKSLFENTDQTGVIDVFDNDNDNDGILDGEDQMIDDMDPEGDPDAGIPDWHPKSKHKQ